MSPGNWPNQYKPIQPGEPVSAGVANRPASTLEQRTRYLKDRLDAAVAGGAVFDMDATVASDVLENSPVFWNAIAQQYENALAAVTTDGTGNLVATPSANCSGMVFAKKGANLADIVLYGVVEMPELANAVSGGILPGRYYLSSATAGQITLQRPAVTVPVCIVYGPKSTCDTVPRVLVNPQTRDFQGDHVHYRISLVCRPAGETSSHDARESGRHVIFNANPGEPGWLPADHASFNGRAPLGAAFGYNLPQHQALNRLWPPVPLQAVAVLWDKGEGRIGATEAPQGLPGLVICDASGIWWMSDCYGDVPWPTYFDNTPSLSSSLSVSSEMADPRCPRQEAMRVDVVFLRMLYANNQQVVTSITPATGSPLTFTNCDGVAAKTGDLIAGFDLAATLNPAEAYGGQVLKNVAEGLVFSQGWVAEGLLAGSSRVVLTSAHSRYRTPGDATTPEVYQGLVTVDVNPDPTAQELPPQMVRLMDAVDRLYQNVPYVGFPLGRASGIRSRFSIPPAGLASATTVVIHALLLSLADGTLPDLTMTYNRIALPALNTPVALPVGDTAVAFTSSSVVTANQLVLVTSDPISVAAGDTLLVSLLRPLGDSFPGELGVVRLGAILGAS